MASVHYAISLLLIFHSSFVRTNGISDSFGRSDSWPSDQSLLEDDEMELLNFKFGPKQIVRDRKMAEIKPDENSSLRERWELDSITPEMLSLVTGKFDYRFGSLEEDIPQVQAQVEPPTFTSASDVLASVSSRLPACQTPFVSAASNEKGNITWAPAMNKYVYADCVRGTVNLRYLCIRKYAGLAARLARVLIIPSSDTDADGISYKYNLMVHLGQSEACLRGKYIVLLDDLLKEKMVHNLSVAMACWDRQACSADRCSSDKILDDKVVREGGCRFLELSASGSLEKAVSDLDDKAIISFGDVALIGGAEDVSFDFESNANAPLRIRNDCQLAIRPDRAITETAFKFIRRMIGADSIAVHVRRDQLIGRCRSTKPEDIERCKAHVARFAACIVNRLSYTSNFSIVYVSTNARHPEILLLKNYLEAMAGRPFMVTPLLPIKGAVWADEFQGLAESPDAVTLLEQTISAMVPVFVAHTASAFTETVKAMRASLKTGSCLDIYSCSSF